MLAGTLKKALHVQVDGGDRTKSLFGMVGIVLGLGWVEHVTVESLIVGHEDVDRMFSRFWKNIKKTHNKPRSYDEIVELFLEVYVLCENKKKKHGEVTVNELQHVWNWDIFLKPMLNKNTVSLLKGKRKDKQEDKPDRFEIFKSCIDGIDVIVMSAYKTMTLDPTNAKDGLKIRNAPPDFESLAELSLKEGYDMFKASFITDC